MTKAAGGSRSHRGWRDGRDARLVALHALAAPDGTTSFMDLLMMSTPPEVELLPFSWRTALIGGYDVLHIHWPEFLLRGRTSPRTLMKRVGATVLLGRLALTRTPVVRTIHNTEPHEGTRRFERGLVGAFDRLTKAEIVLNPTTPVTSVRPRFLVPHNHYRDVECFAPNDARTGGGILYFGLVREYKGLDDLMVAYDELVASDVALRIVGQPKNAKLVDRVSAFAARRPAVTTRFEYLADEELAAEISESSVVVLPYQRMHNSGALLLALSIGRTVVAPATPSTRLVRDEVGSEWLHLYEGERVTAAILEVALEAATTRPAGLFPEFRDRDREEIGERHHAVYRSVVEGNIAGDTVLDYLVGGVRISLASPSNTPGPRTHILNFLRAAENLGVRHRLFLASNFPLLGRFARVRQTQYQDIGTTRTVVVDVVRFAVLWWSGLVTFVRSARQVQPTIIYERLSVYQSLTSFHRYRRRAVRVVEANGVLSRETSRDRKISRAEWLTSAIERHVLRAADVVVVVSEPLASELAEFAGLDRRAIVVVPNGLDRALLAVPRTPTNTFVFGFVGSVVAWHDLDTVVSAICRTLCDRKVVVDGRPVAVEIVGDGPALASLRDTVEARGWSDFVSFTGRLPQPEAVHTMARWDVGISSHRASSSSTMYHSPLKLYEYAGLGLEILCTPSRDARSLAGSGAAVHIYEDEGDLLDILSRPKGFGRSASDIESSRRAVARDHSWERRVETVLAAAIGSIE